MKNAIPVISIFLSIATSLVMGYVSFEKRMSVTEAQVQQNVEKIANLEAKQALQDARYLEIQTRLTRIETLLTLMVPKELQQSIPGL